MSKRRTHRPEFKARVAMEAISGRKTIQEIAADHAIHPIQVSEWKKQLLEGRQRAVHQGQEDQGQEREPGQGGRAVSADRPVADGAGVAQKKSQLL